MSNLDIQYKWVKIVRRYVGRAEVDWEFLAFPANSELFNDLHKSLMKQYLHPISAADQTLTNVVWEFDVPHDDHILNTINYNIQRSNELLAHNRLLRNTLDIFEQEDSDSS